MVSSRESFPAGSTNSPLQLTPNSKVKALLASFSDDSDQENGVESARARLKASLANRSISKPETFEESADQAVTVQSQDTGKDSQSSSEEEIVRPKGRVAARMLANDESSAEERENSENARARVKKLILKTQSNISSPENESVESIAEEDTPVVSRKRKIRKPRHESPTPRKGPASPCLFVSPTAPKSATPLADESDSEELPDNAVSVPEDNRFKALVERKRKERQAKEADEAAKKAKQMAERKRHTAMIAEDDDISDHDDEGGRRLTQQARPTRKASKKALEDISRETQRMSRGMQLAHAPITKKKMPMADFLKRMGYRSVVVKEEKTPEPSLPNSSSPARNSDAETHETPPTSPASHESDVQKFQPTLETLAASEEEMVMNDLLLPLEKALDAASASPPKKLDKGKGRAAEEPSPEPREVKKKYEFKQRPIRIRAPKLEDRKTTPLDDSDSDLEIVTAKTPGARMKKLNSVFDRAPGKQAKESHSLHVLKTLAHLSSPGKQNLGRNKKPSMTPTELQQSLQQRARQQAAQEREDRLKVLRDKGIIIQSAEEREREMAEVENLIAKARREGEEIMQREKAAAKKERKAKGEVDPLGESSDDEDWEEEKQNLSEELSASGSDDEEGGGSDASGEEEDGEDEEEEEEAMDLDDAQQAPGLNPMFDNEAGESDDDEAEGDLSVDETAETENMDDGDEEQRLPSKPAVRRIRNVNVISDDEEDDNVNSTLELPAAPQIKSPTQTHTNSLIAPNSVLRSATKTFIPGLTVIGPVGLGLTQIFAGTMDESQMDASQGSPTVANSATPEMNFQQDSLAFLKRLPAPELPPFAPTMPSMDEDSQDVVMDSQSALSHIPESQPIETQTQGIQLGFSQSQIHGFDSLVDPLQTQFSEFPEATQDAGFQHMTPIKGRFVDAPPSTVETIVLDPTTAAELIQETPTVKKKGKLRRRAQVAAFSEDEDAEEPHQPIAEEDEFEITSNVFDVMRNASRKKRTVVDEFDKKKSKAKEMVNEQAEESEDEYAGLGGASDDESGGEEDEYVKQMIDDEGGHNLDESKLAAFFADRERASDEKQVEKLYSDIAKGMLRRKRGADYDLSDSDDGGEARRRMKQREFAKMRKALLADERIGKIAENPKQQAFLRAIEDRGSEDEMDFLDDFKEQDETTDSQSQSQAEDESQRVPNSQPDVAMGPPKRKRSDVTEPENRAAPHLRRTKPEKKPTNLSEIRESLSSLIEEPNSMAVPAPESDTEDELEIEGESEQTGKDKENRNPFAPRRTNVPIIDRISLKRASSSSLSTSARLAFAASSSAPGFKVPPLLRRATTNNSIASGSSSTNSSVTGGVSATERMAGGSSEGIKRGAGKNSGVHYFARETERKAAVIKTEKRREQKRFKGAEIRRKVVGGLFGGGKFE